MLTITEAADRLEGILEGAVAKSGKRGTEVGRVEAGYRLAIQHLREMDEENRVIELGKYLW